MEESIKKKVGRPRKKDGRGGKREGAGRKTKGDTARTKHFSFGVSEITVQRSQKLRELTKNDDMPFVDMLESWIEQLAKDYGIE